MNAISGPYAWLITFIALVLAVAVRSSLDPWLGDLARYTALLLVVAFASAFIGWRAGIVTMVLGGAASFYLLVYLPGGLETRDLVQFGLYAAVSLLITAVAEWGRRRGSRAADLADNISQLAWVADEKGWVFWYNKRWYDYTGTTLEEMKGWGWQKVYHSEHVQRVVEKVRLSCETGKPWEDTFPLRGKDGSYRWFLSRAVPAKDGTWIGTHTDITREKQTEEALHRQAALLDLSPDAIIVRTEDGTIKLWSTGAERLYGWKKEEALGKQVHSLLQTEFPEPLESIIKQLRGGRDWTGELVHTAKDGRKLTVQSFWHAEVVDTELELLESNVDITDRKRADKALRDSEQRLRKFFESDIIGVIYWNMDGKIHDANDKFLRMIGYNREDLAAGRISWEEMTPPGYQEVDQKAIAELQATGVDTPYEKEYTRKDGSRIPILVGAAMLDENMYEGVAFVLDITERRRAEEARRESEEQLAAFMRYLPGAAWIKNVDGRYVYANPEAELIFGSRLEQLRGKTDEDIFPPHTASQFRENDLRALREGGSVQTTEVLRQPDGEEHHSIVSKFPLLGSAAQPVGIGGVAFDITDRIKAEEALRTSERNYRIVADNTYAWEFWVDLQGKYRYVSPSCARWTGYESKEFMADPHLFDRIICAEDRAKYHEHRGGGERCETEEVEFRIVRRDGAVRWIGHACNPVYDEYGRFLGIRGSNRDITEQKRGEAELKTAQLSANQARVTAERANAAKDEFLAVLSHELRTPLTPILAATQLMQRTGELSDRGRQLVEIIRRNLELEARLIDDLLDLTRIIRGKITLEKKVVNICYVLERVSAICGPDIEAKRLHFGIDLKDPPHPVNGDLGRLQQVFWNLVKNSIKFTPEGGCVGIRAFRTDGQIAVEVVDSGIGIEAEVMPRIFDAFEQGDRRITRQFGGLGLGLAITKRLVELHGGTISAASAGKNNGATFRITLPTIETHVMAEAENARRPSPTRSRRILLTEDHADTAAMMRALLEGAGYEVETAADIAQSLGAIDQREFDLLISDLGLPDGSGLQLMAELRHRHKPLKGIALSGFGREEDVKRSKEAGFAEHLTKPVAFDTLLTVIERVM